MKKNLLTLTTGMLLGALITVFVPGNIQVTITNGKMTSENAELIPVVAVEESTDEEHDTVASETAEDVVYEGVSEMDTLDLNKDERAMMDRYDTFRGATDRNRVTVDKSLVDIAQMYNKSFISGEEKVYSGNITDTQFMYAGVTKGVADDESAGNIINFWMEMELGRNYLLKENIKYIGASVERIGSELYFVLILDWGSVR